MKIILVVCLFVGFVAAQHHPEGPHHPPQDGSHHPPPDGHHPPPPGGPHPSNTTCLQSSECNIPDPDCQNICIDNLCHCHLPPVRRALCREGHPCVCPDNHHSFCLNGHCHCPHIPGVGK